MFQKGQSGNPRGRPKGATGYAADLTRAIRTVEKEQGKSLLQHFVERAFKSDKVLAAVAKKLIPDLATTKQEFAAAELPPIEIILYADTQSKTKQ